MKIQWLKTDKMQGMELIFPNPFNQRSICGFLSEIFKIFERGEMSFQNPGTPHLHPWALTVVIIVVVVVVVVDT